MSRFAPFCALTFVFAIACDNGSDPEGGPRLEGLSPAPSGPGVFSMEFDQSEAYFSNMAEPAHGDSPHGLVQIWYSSNIAGLVGGFNYEVPVGTVAIKKGFAEPTEESEELELRSITVMIKREAGYDDAHGNWEYSMRKPDGTVALDEETGEPIQGPVKMCIGCHQTSQTTDYLAGTFVR